MKVRFIKSPMAAGTYDEWGWESYVNILTKEGDVCDSKDSSSTRPGCRVLVTDGGEA